MPYDVIETVRRLYGCNAVLEGSGSLVPDGAESDPLPSYDGDPEPLYSNFLPPEIVGKPSPPRMWFTTVDGRRRVNSDGPRRQPARHR